jgi:hypothetical protein
MAAEGPGGARGRARVGRNERWPKTKGARIDIQPRF